MTTTSIRFFVGNATILHTKFIGRNATAKSATMFRAATELYSLGPRQRARTFSKMSNEAWNGVHWKANAAADDRASKTVKMSIPSQNDRMCFDIRE